MNFRTTAVLLALVAIGGAIWYFAPAAKPPTERTEETPTPRETTYVFDPRPESEAIQSLTFEVPGKHTLAFERVEDPSRPGAREWKMTTPIASRTESYMVDGLATALSSLVSQRHVPIGEKGVTLAAAGLEPPLATLSVTDKDGKTSALQIGQRVPLSNDTYVRVAGAPDVQVVNRGFDTELKRTANDYRAKALFRFSVPDVRRVTVDQADQHCELALNDLGQWIIDAPVKAAGDTLKIKKLLTDIANVRAQEFVENEPASLEPFGLASPHLRVQFTTETRREIKPEPGASQPTTSSAPAAPQYETIQGEYALLVGGFADIDRKLRFVKLGDQPWVATVPVDALDKLEPRVADWRDPVITRIKAADVTRFDLTVGDSGITVERQDDHWTCNQPGAAIDDESVRQLLTAFEDARSIDYIDQPESLATYGLEPPRATLRVTSRNRVEPLVLEIGGATPSGRNTFVKLGHSQGVLVISDAQASKLAASPLSLRSKTLTDFDPELLRGLRLTRGEQVYELTRTTENGILQPWTLTQPAGAPADPAAVRELTSTVARLRAKTLVGEGDLERYGLQSPAITVEFVREPADTPASRPASAPAESQPSPPDSQEAPAAPITQTLQIGRAGGTLYCRIDDQPLVYQLDGTHLPVFSAELIRRRLFDFKADALQVISIQAPGGALDFTRDGANWIFAPEPVVALSQTKMKELADTLAGLMADAYLAYSGGDLEAQGLASAPVTVVLKASGDDGAMQPVTLKIDQVAQGELPRKAAWVEQQRIFLLRQADIERLLRGLDAYVKIEGEKDEPAVIPQP